MQSEMFIWYEIFFWRKRISMFRWQSSYLAYMRIYLHLSSLHTTDTAANHVTQAGCWISKWRTSEATSTKCGCGVWDDATHQWGTHASATKRCSAALKSGRKMKTSNGEDRARSLLYHFPERDQVKKKGEHTKSMRQKASKATL